MKQRCDTDPLHVLAVIDAAIEHLTNPCAVTLTNADGLRIARQSVARLLVAADSAERELASWSRDGVVSLGRAAKAQAALSKAIDLARGDVE